MGTPTKQSPEDFEEFLNHLEDEDEVSDQEMQELLSGLSLAFDEPFTESINASVARGNFYFEPNQQFVA